MAEEIKIESLQDLASISLRLTNYLQKPEAKPFILTIKEAKPQRSTVQNSYYWAGIVMPAVRFYKGNLFALIKDVLKAVSFTEVTKDFVHELFKMLFNKKESTRKLTMPEMVIYADEIREHFWHEHQHDIPPPNTPPIEGE